MKFGKVLHTSHFLWKFVFYKDLVGTIRKKSIHTSFSDSFFSVFHHFSPIFFMWISSKKFWTKNTSNILWVMTFLLFELFKTNHQENSSSVWCLRHFETEKKGRTQIFVCDASMMSKWRHLANFVKFEHILPNSSTLKWLRRIKVSIYWLILLSRAL